MRARVEASFRLQVEQRPFLIVRSGTPRPYIEYSVRRIGFHVERLTRRKARDRKWCDFVAVSDPRARCLPARSTMGLPPQSC